MEILQVDQTKKAEEVTFARADGAVWVRDVTIQQYPASSPMFKWLNKYFLTEEDEETAIGIPTDQDTPVDQDPSTA